jgi:hypothetical protein
MPKEVQTAGTSSSEPLAIAASPRPSPANFKHACQQCGMADCQEHAGLGARGDECWRLPHPTVAQLGRRGRVPSKSSPLSTCKSCTWHAYPVTYVRLHKWEVGTRSNMQAEGCHTGRAVGIGQSSVCRAAVEVGAARDPIGHPWYIRGRAATWVAGRALRVKLGVPQW